ncbi:MAG: hypothetical protein H6Q66_601 [Firmicutes bacterium]|nr:hypothetical protein [Bacillota bacterium]
MHGEMNDCNSEVSGLSPLIFTRKRGGCRDAGPLFFPKYIHDLETVAFVLVAF